MTAILTLRPKSDADVVSSAWDCQAFNDAEKAGRDVDRLNYIANCAIDRVGTDVGHAISGQAVKYGYGPEDVKTVMDCIPHDEPDATARCLLDAGLVHVR